MSWQNHAYTGAQEMHRCASSHGARWSMVVAGQVWLGRTIDRPTDRRESVGTEDGGGIGEDDIGA